MTDAKLALASGTGAEAMNAFGACTCDRFIDTASVPGEARLSPSLLVTNEMGVTASVPETLSAGNWARVVLDVPSTAVRGAQLLFYTNRDERTVHTPMKLWVNGRPLEHRQVPERMLTGGWDRIDIPAGFLKNGPNLFVFAQHGILHVDPKPQGRSQRSFDGGVTWHSGALGAERNISGEYMVRLRLHGHAPSGRLCSPVVDLADLEGKGSIAPRTGVARVALTTDLDTPDGTRASFALRTGTSPCFDPLFWTPWQEASELDHPERFVQWQAVLETDSADRTPVLRAVTLSVDRGKGEAGPDGVEVTAFECPAIVRSSYAFSYMPPHPKLTRLLGQYRLKEVVAAGKTDLERLALLRDWVHSQWLGWQSDKYPYCPSWDPMEILETTKGNWGFGMCTHYAATFVGCAAALGYAARSVIVDHHCLAEVWSDELGKWILQDPGPSREYDATYERDDVPLNALEVHEILARGAAEELRARKLPQAAVAPMEERVAKCFVRFGIPLRNDHLINPEPAELEHGNEQYHWDGYLWWTDDPAPRYPEYSLQSGRPGDFYPTLNRTRIHLGAGAAPRTLQVDLETLTPNFETYLKQVDSGAWERAGHRFDWELHAGENQMSVRSVNRFGRQGSPSQVTVRCR